MFFVRVFDRELNAWVLVDHSDDEEQAKEIGRSHYRRGAAGIKISEQVERVVVEVKRPS